MFRVLYGRNRVNNLHVTSRNEIFLRYRAKRFLRQSSHASVVVKGPVSRAESGGIFHDSYVPRGRQLSSKLYRGVLLL